MKNFRNLIMILVAVLAIPTVGAHHTGSAVPGTIEKGKASWYCIKCNGGTHTASGKKLNDWAMTAAHKTLPMGTKVRVTNKENGRSIVVTITDRGPYIKGRVIDVTKGVAHKLGFVVDGVVDCEVEIL